VLPASGPISISNIVLGSSSNARVQFTGAAFDAETTSVSVNCTLQNNILQPTLPLGTFLLSPATIQLTAAEPTQNVDVQFTPSVAGVYKATLSCVPTNAIGGPYSHEITAIATAPP